MWEEKGLTNTPEGVSPEKRMTTTKNKPITKEDDRLPPSGKLGSPGGDILQKKEILAMRLYLDLIQLVIQKTKRRKWKSFRVRHQKMLLKRC